MVLAWQTRSTVKKVLRGKQFCVFAEFKTSSQSYPQREQRNYCQKASVRARNSRHANNELVADEPFIDGCRMEARVSPCEITQANYEKNGHFLTPQDELRNVVSDTEGCYYVT